MFFRNCEDCDITVCCSQFRCRDLVSSRVNLYTPNDPIVESSTDLTFGPFNLKYPLLQQHSDKADLTGSFTDDDEKMQVKYNHWDQIFDFTKKDEGANFKLVTPDQFKFVTVSELLPDFDSNLWGESNSDWIFDLPTEFGGSLEKAATPAKDGLMAFDIKTGAEAA